jgi:DnaK suppressor protein
MLQRFADEACSKADPIPTWPRKKDRTETKMDKQRVNYFRNLLLEQRRRATEAVQADHSNALSGGEGVPDSGDSSMLDVNKSTAFDLGERELHLIEEIDRALRRIDEGTYGQCVRCGKPIDEQRLEAMPTATVDTECQASIEAAQGVASMPTL